MTGRVDSIFLDAMLNAGLIILHAGSQTIHQRVLPSRLKFFNLLAERIVGATRRPFATSSYSRAL